MAAAYVQHITGAAKNNGSTLVMPGNTVAGNHIVVIGIHSYAGCPPTISDSQGNTYTVKGANPDTGTGLLKVYTAPVGSSAACTLTCSMACGEFHTITAIEVSGLATDPYDVQAVNTGDSASPCDAGTLTPSADGAFLAAIWKRATTLSETAVSSPFTLVNGAGTDASAYGVQATAASITPQLTCTSSAGFPVRGGVVAFAAASGGGGGGFNPAFARGSNAVLISGR